MPGLRAHDWTTWSASKRKLKSCLAATGPAIEAW
jgi:hypothetical protein